MKDGLKNGLMWNAELLNVMSESSLGSFINQKIKQQMDVYIVKPEITKKNYYVEWKENVSKQL